MEDFDNTFKNVLSMFKDKPVDGYNDDELFNAVDLAVNIVHNEELQAILIKSRNGESSYCNQCGRCCRTYGIVLRPEDIYNLSKTVDITDNITHEGMIYKFKEKPCQYLEKDGRCGCYENRPLTCKNHPLTNPEHPRIIRDPDCNYILHLFYDIAFSMLTKTPFGGK